MSTAESLDRLARSIISFEDGDVLQMAEWIQTLEALATDVDQVHRASVHALADVVKAALRDDSPGWLDALTQGLDELSRGLSQTPAPEVSLWTTHGPAFVSETKVRLARAQELILGMETTSTDEDRNELFRVFHTIKGEAGFLQRDDLVAAVHATEGVLDELRSGRQRWTPALADRLLADVDRVTTLLNPGTTASSREAPSRTPTSDEILRVSASKIDALVAQVGELLVALDSGNDQVTPVVRKLSRGLQQTALKLRTEPFRALAGQLKRGARDLARDLAKAVDVEVTGEGLELDRDLIARLEEPLMHMIRNSLDHGIESAEVRRLRNKPETGRLGIALRRRGNRIEIEVSDDGGGLDADKIWSVAVAKGLVQGDQPEPAQVYPLIYRPGFSTAEGVSKVSGRGVGMDVVARTVAEARGRVDVDSVPGQGLKVTLSFPLSTAVVDGLVVRVGKRRFVVPVHSVRESLLVPQTSLRLVAESTQVFTLRGEPLEVQSLARILDGQATGTEAWGMVTETTDGHRHLLLVDEVEAKREVVIRSLGALFQNLRGVSAATILTGGQLALVLDIDQLLALAGVAR